MPPLQAEFRGVKKTSGDMVDLGPISLDKRNLSLASEKDLKTCANIDTKFKQVILQSNLIQDNQDYILQVQKKWSGGSLKSPDRDLELDQLYKVCFQTIT